MLYVRTYVENEKLRENKTFLCVNFFFSFLIIKKNVSTLL